jgi:hypothetical protein
MADAQVIWRKRKLLAAELKRCILIVVRNPAEEEGSLIENLAIRASGSGSLGPWLNNFEKAVYLVLT